LEEGVMSGQERRLLNVQRIMEILRIPEDIPEQAADDYGKKAEERLKAELVRELAEVAEREELWYFGILMQEALREVMGIRRKKKPAA
jgi:hypothetical protein